MKKFAILFASLLVSGIAFAGGVEKGSLAIAVPCAIWLAIGSFIVFAFSRGE